MTGPRTGRPGTRRSVAMPGGDGEQPAEVPDDEVSRLRPQHDELVRELARQLPPPRKGGAKMPAPVQVAELVRSCTDAWGDDDEQLGWAVALLAWDRGVRVDPTRGVEHGLVNLALAGFTMTRGARLHSEVRLALARLRSVAAEDLAVAALAGGGIDRISREPRQSPRIKKARKAAAAHRKAKSRARQVTSG